MKHPFILLLAPHFHQSPTIVSATTTTTTTNNNNNNNNKNNNNSTFNITMPVYIHSTFRDSRGRAIRPEGLEWDLDGESHVRFAVPVFENIDKSEIIQAYNRWCCAKDLPYRTEDDILAIIPQGPDHVHVEWKQQVSYIEKVIRNDDNNIAELLRNDEAVTTAGEGGGGGGGSPAEVWINGDMVGVLSSADQLDECIQQIPKTANKLCFKRAPGRIYIERYYTSYLRKPQAWDHIWDNLVALEDPQIIDDKTLIGTATLADWIMGGELTSRLWVQDKEKSILFLRPLYDDDIESSDRRYELSDPFKMALVRAELDRLRYLARLRHPYVTELLEKAKTKRQEQEQQKEEVYQPTYSEASTTLEKDDIIDKSR